MVSQIPQGNLHSKQSCTYHIKRIEEDSSVEWQGLTPLSVRLLRVHEIFERLPKLLSIMPPALNMASSSSSSMAASSH